jgi:hypothetical protein
LDVGPSFFFFFNKDPCGLCWARKVSPKKNPNNRECLCCFGLQKQLWFAEAEGFCPGKMKHRAWGRLGGRRGGRGEKGGQRTCWPPCAAAHTCAARMHAAWCAAATVQNGRGKLGCKGSPGKGLEGKLLPRPSGAEKRRNQCV